MTVINNPECWKTRTTAEVDKIREAPPEPAPEGAGPPKKPPLNGIDDLISQGHLADDGRTVLSSLNNIAVYLSGKKVAVTKVLLKRYFAKNDGTEYSDRALTDAVNIANAN